MLKNKPLVTRSIEEISSWLSHTPNPDFPSLEQALFVLSASKTANTQHLIQTTLTKISDQLDAVPARSLARLLARAAAVGGDEEFFAKASEAVRGKGVNAFSPEDLATVALALAQGGIRDLEVRNFVRREAQHVLPDLSVRAVLKLLEAERRNFGGDRKFLDQLVERLSDTVDRMTASDVTFALGIFSKWGLGRGYVIRRMTALAVDNLHALSVSQRIGIFASLAKLRFLGNDEESLFLETLVADIPRMESAEISELMLGLGLVGSIELEARTAVRSEVLQQMLANPEKFSPPQFIEALWGVCAVTPRAQDTLGLGSLPPAMEVVEREANEKVLEKVKTLLGVAMQFPVPKHRALSLKLLEVGAYLNTPINPTFRVDEAEKVDAEKAEISRMHAEFQTVLDSFKGRSFARGALIGSFRVDFFDERNKIAIDLDTLSRPTTRVLRSRVFNSAGAVKYVVVDYWKWRTVCRSTKEQTDFVKNLLQ